MIIKDIQKFRENWKNKEGFNGFDHNFIGAKKNDINGFYRIVNGTVYDIKSDLTPKLQNAQDEQAIYEFLQNAADSASTECAIIYDEDYFMVINNGNPFSINDVTAILNSFQGTKADKSKKENCDKIGRYGIGFKLVHRLVGKSDGARELIEKLEGPVIFSWHKESQLKSLFDWNGTFNKDSDLDSKNSPWLFKILLTCFPALPAEQVKGIDYNDIIVYKHEEFELLPKFLNKHRKRIDALNLEQGSLFFLKFGENKHSKLEDSLKNINSGIGYSLNMLKSLDNVILQDNHIKRIPIERIDIRIEPTEDAFKKIDPEFPECPIDILFGYLKDDYESLKKASNIYQYFPMRNESHGLSFLIHSTSFAKVTDRTKLDDQGESNIHTFQFICNKLKLILKDEYQTNNIDKAKQIFQAVVLSEKSERQNSQLIVKEFLSPLIEYFKNNVPTKENSFHPNYKVVIKNTRLTLNPIDFGIQKIWFNWDDIESNSEIIKQSENKLNIERYSLKRLLEEGDINKTNHWLCSQSNLVFENFISELEDNIPKNLIYLKIIRLEDDSLCSLAEISSSNVILKFPKIKLIENVLRSLKFRLSKTDYESFQNLKRKIAEYFDYLKEDGEAKLYEKKISPALPNSLLSPEEKILLFKALSDFKYIGKETLRDKLVLFSNSNGEKQPLAKLIDPSIPGLEKWLFPYCLKKEELFDAIKSDDFLRGLKTIYNDIIVLKWDEIIKQVNENDVPTLYQSVIKYYNLALTPTSLKSKCIIYCHKNGWLVPSDKIFFHNQLSTFDKLSDLSELMDKLGIIYPYNPILKFLTTEPFTLKDSSVDRLSSSGTYSIGAALALIEFCKGKINVFDFGVFSKTTNDLCFSNDRNRRQFYSESSLVQNFIADYCNGMLVKLPEELSLFKENVLKGESLYESIISISKKEWITNEKALTSLLNLLSESGLIDIAKKFIKETEQINLRSDYIEGDVTFNWIKLINRVFELGELELIKKIIFIDDIALSGLTWNNTFYLEDEERIEIASVLSKYGESKIISELKEKLIATKIFNTQKVSSLFRSDNSPDDAELLNIAKEMLGVESNKLKTVDQLRLVIYLYKKKLLLTISDILVVAKDGNWYSLADDWYYNPWPFIDNSAVLHERYQKIGRKIYDSYVIINKPVFYKEESRFICPHLCTSIEGDALIQFFELIKDQIKKNAQTNVNWVDGFASNIGFFPKQTILAENKFIHEDEKLPEAIIKWASQSEENKKTLKVIGVHIEDSYVLKLRKYLLNETDSNYTFEGFLSNKIDKILLLNSLAIMADAEIKFNDDFGSIIKKITEFIGMGLSLDISQIHLPIAVKIENSNLIYQMESVNSAYLLSPGFVGMLKKYVGADYISYIERIIESGVNIVDPDCLDENWQSIYTKKLEITPPVINEELLRENSFECDLKQYSRWKETSDSKVDIYFIEESIPYSTSIKDFEELTYLEYSYGDSYFDEENQILFTKKGESFVSQLSKLRDHNYITTSDLTFLLSENGLAVLTEVDDLKKQNEHLKELLKTKSPGDGLERGGMDVEGQIDWNREAREMLKKHLETINEFDCKDWDDSNIPSSVVKGVKYLEKPCVWVIRSAMNNESKFHLTPYEWTLFEQKNVFLALRISQDEIKIYGINEDIRNSIYENNHTINFNFDSAMLTFNGINALSKLLVESNVWGSGLVFKNPHYSTGNSLKDLNKCKEGIINKLNDDAL